MGGGPKKPQAKPQAKAEPAKNVESKTSEPASKTESKIEDLTHIKAKPENQNLKIDKATMDKIMKEEEPDQTKSDFLVNPQKQRWVEKDDFMKKIFAHPKLAAAFADPEMSKIL